MSGVLLEIERNIQEVAEVAGEAPNSEWLVSILYNIMDDPTKTHCSGSLDMDTSLATLRYSVMSLVNLVGGTSNNQRGPAPMEIDQI